MEAFGLDVRFGRAIAARVMLNGIEVGGKEPGDIVAQSLALQHDVMPGENRIEIHVATAGIPFDAGTRQIDGNPEEFFVEATLERDTIRELADRYEITTEEIEHRQWEPSSPITLPHRIEISFTAPVTVSRPAWLDADPVEPERARGEAAGVLDQLREALVGGHYAAFEEMMRIRNADFARAYPASGNADQRAADDGAMLAQLLGPDPSVAPVDPANLKLVGEAGGRLVRVHRAEGAGALLARGVDGAPVEIEIAFSKLGNRLVPVR
ncbi:hypothetical protein N0B51_04070 [Tsuneonella sp. YG55]|uniref:Uncharacterized protein n=1 Tax=Tsuneonella litorea TaxID=2976475 RepID=A0A9X2W042_9SPHN|nr:hypothetical protein [Tsuneonella litorea]MCT2558148.1 hypothetical protein [Tsuneonella litorea]